MFRSMKWAALALGLQAGCASAASSEGPLIFLSPGASYTGSLGLEASAGILTFENYLLRMAGLLYQNEPGTGITSFGLEVGFYAAQLELGAAFAGGETGIFLTPNFCLGVPEIPFAKSALVVNLFYRTYWGIGRDNSFGMSLKIPFFIVTPPG